MRDTKAGIRRLGARQNRRAQGDPYPDIHKQSQLHPIDLIKIDLLLSPLNRLPASSSVVLEPQSLQGSVRGEGTVHQLGPHHERARQAYPRRPMIPSFKFV
jgi:hypothetical protein